MQLNCLCKKSEETINKSNDVNTKYNGVKKEYTKHKKTKLSTLSSDLKQMQSEIKRITCYSFKLEVLKAVEGKSVERLWLLRQAG